MNSTITDEPLLDADDAAVVLRVKRGTVYDWAKKNILPHVRIMAGRRRPVIRFRRSELQEFIERRSRHVADR